MYVELHYAVDPVVSMRLLQDPARLAIVWATFMSQAAGVGENIHAFLLGVLTHTLLGSRCTVFPYAFADRSSQCTWDRWSVLSCLQMYSVLTLAHTGLHMMPNTLARAIGGVIAGVVRRFTTYPGTLNNDANFVQLISKTGRYYHSALVFAIIPAIPSFLMAGLTERTYEFITWLALIPGGLGNAGFGSIAFSK
jgi:hypothetical protein